MSFAAVFPVELKKKRRACIHLVLDVGGCSAISSAVDETGRQAQLQESCVYLSTAQQVCLV